MDDREGGMEVGWSVDREDLGVPDVSLHTASGNCGSLLWEVEVQVIRSNALSRATYMCRVHDGGRHLFAGEADSVSQIMKITHLFKAQLASTALLAILTIPSDCFAAQPLATPFGK
jgi:hypothetical protein